MSHALRIPAELQSRPQWVAWRYEQRPGEAKLTKVPYQDDGKKAKTNEPSTWTTFERVCRYAEKAGVDGIGFVFSAADEYVGIDLDHVRDAVTGVMDPWAARLLERLDSYTEISPSGEGTHTIVRGTLPAGRRRLGRFEWYSAGRFFTFTGNVWDDEHTEIAERTSVLTKFSAEIFPADEVGVDVESGESEEPDDTIITRLLASSATFQQLFGGGDIPGYNEAHGIAHGQSEADLALVNAIYRVNNCDIAQTDRIMRQSPLMRDKWDEWRGTCTYGQRTLGQGLKHRHTSPTLGHKGASLNGTAQATTAPLTDDPLHRTDLGNARRLVRLYGAQMRHCARLGGWYAYDGVRWQQDETRLVESWAKSTVRTIYTEALSAQDEDERKAIAKWAMTSEARARIEAMVALSPSEPGLSVGPSLFDQDSWVLNCQNGTLDLRTYELRPHTPNDYLTKCIATKYDLAAICPSWDAFLERILPDPSVRTFVQKMAGYSLTGSTRERLFVILHGNGANGKSTFLDTIRTMLGDYAMQTPAETLMVRRDHSIPNDIARLRGARFVSAVEAEEGKRLAESLVKQITGGVDVLTARFLHAEFFEFRPEFKMWLATNHRPVIYGTDKAIWDRIRLVPFEVRIPAEEQDRTLSDRLLQEMPGILAWAVEGCRLWQQEGLGVPEKVMVATGEYRTEMDTLGAFITDCCDEDPQLFVLSAALYRAYVAWCENSGEKPLSQKALAPRLSERGYASKHTMHGRAWYGIGIHHSNEGGGEK